MLGAGGVGELFWVGGSGWENTLGRWEWVYEALCWVGRDWWEKFWVGGSGCENILGE